VARDVERKAPVVRDVDRKAPVARDVDRKAPVVRDSDRRAPVARDTDRAAPVARDVDRRNRDWADGRNRDGDWNRGRWDNGHHGHHHHDDHDDDDWWQYLAFGTAARLLGVPFGYYGYGYPNYGYGYGYPYGYGYGHSYGHGYGYGYGPSYDNGYRSYYYDEPQSDSTTAYATTSAATIDVLVNDPDARVWVQGRETTSRGTERTFTSPGLESGYSYTYTVKARWTENGETLEAERQVTVSPGTRVTVDFTRGPARAI
jgi:uncharacterized protein (TIGR03000 family)